MLKKLLERIEKIDHSNDRNLFIKINQDEELDKYEKTLSTIQINNKIKYIDCIEGIFIFDYKKFEIGRLLRKQFEKEEYPVEFTNNQPKVKPKHFNKNYVLSSNFYVIDKKESHFNVERSFKNLLYQIKGDIKYGLTINYKTASVFYDDIKGQVIVSFDYVVKSVDKDTPNEIINYLEERYKYLLKHFHLVSGSV
jgi:hypothetical protein